MKWTKLAVLLGFYLACGGKAVIDGSPGAGGGSATSCGDAKLVAAFAACRAAKDEASCLAAGGDWTIVGLAGDPECLCQTGQGACPCTAATQCLGQCIGMAGNKTCDGVTQGLCSRFSATVGCDCFFQADGSVQRVCVD